MKWWIGAAAELATMSIVWAQVIIDGESRGVAGFAVPLRDKQTYQVLPGIVIGDCGPKNGLNGIDNGFIQFKNYRVPYDAMLDRFQKIKDSGEFFSEIEDDGKRFAFQFGSLSGGRVAIPNQTTQLSIMALTIALRYSCQRLQFGNPDEPELPIIEYPLTQHR